MTDNAEPVQEGGDHEMVTTERALDIGKRLASGEEFTPFILSRDYGIHPTTALRILWAAERVLGIEMHEIAPNRFVWRKMK